MVMPPNSRSASAPIAILASAGSPFAPPVMVTVYVDTIPGNTRTRSKGRVRLKVDDLRLCDHHYTPPRVDLDRRSGRAKIVACTHHRLPTNVHVSSEAAASLISSLVHFRYWSCRSFLEQLEVGGCSSNLVVGSTLPIVSCALESVRRQR